MSPAKGRRTKRAKKQDGIKKPTSAYLYFVSDYRTILKKKGENTSKVQEVAKLCGEAWKSMSDEEKQPYLQKYNTDRSRYMKEVCIFILYFDKILQSPLFYVNF